ncbi:MAG: DUF4350 domain-containing protein [Acidimicrobiales bacterium]
MRWWRAARVLVPVVVALVVANLFVDGWHAELDVSANRRFSLSADTRTLVKAVTSHLEITAFLSDLGGQAKDARFLLARFHELNRHITYRVVDPDTNPGTAKRFGINQYSTVVLTYQGRRADAPDAEELELSTAMVRLLRGRTPVVCMVTGHGEPGLQDTSPAGMSVLSTLLAQNAYRARPLDLTTGTSSVPGECTVVVVAGPVDPLLPTEVTALASWTRAGGRMMVLASPLTRGDPNPLVNAWGITYAGGLVLDPLRDLGLDQSNVIVSDLPTVSPIVTGVSSLQFPAGGGLLVRAGTRGGLTVERLAVSSGQSFVASQPDTETTFHAGDIPGPVTLAASADDSTVVAGPDPRVPGGRDAGHVVRSRVVVTGGDAWATNGFLGDLGNRRFMVNALAWLAGDAQLLSATSRPNVPRALPLTPERRARILVITVGVVPAAILSIALLRRRWARRTR